jgi:carboxymethylenebutenolidase
MDQRIINLYDEYTHKPLSRKLFIQRLIQLTGSSATALSILPMLESDYVKNTLSDSENLFTEYITYKVDSLEMKAYVARPKEEKPYPTVIVIHENRGLNAHIEDVTRRAAEAGFLAVAPNALAPLGGTPANEDEARKLFTQLKPEDNLKNFAKIFDYLPTRKDSNGKYGSIGFCWGGAMSNNLAVNVPSLKAAVAFYGRQAEATDVAKINAALQLHYASLDERVNAGIPAFEEALKKHHKSYELYMYEGVNHAFHNNTSAARYNEAATKLAWERTIAFFRKHLG